MSATKKILSTILAILIIAATIPMSFAVESDGVKTTLDVSEGKVIISDTYVTENGQNIALDPDGYIITGKSSCEDTVLEFLNESTDSVTYNVVFDNLKIVADDYCTALRCKGAGPMILNIEVKGVNEIEVFEQIIFANHGESTLSVYITGVDDSNTLNFDGEMNGIFGGNTVMFINGAEIDSDGEYVEIDYTEIDEYIAEIEQKIADNNVTDEHTAKFEAIKTELKTLKADTDVTSADVDKLMTKLVTYEEALDAGIADGSWVKKDDTPDTPDEPETPDDTTESEDCDGSLSICETLTNISGDGMFGRFFSLLHILLHTLAAIFG